MVDDGELLRRYADEGHEDAFRQIVHRHYDLVYSSALRQAAGDTHLAQDIAQSVFTALARKARRLCRRPTVIGWLYVSTRMAAVQAVRNESRWRMRNLNAETMNESLEGQPPDAGWERVRPLLDIAMCELAESDRMAILDRFFSGRGFSELGAELGVSTDAARMRVDRAVERLRVRLARRGVTSSASALTAALVGNSVAAAPVGLSSAAAGSAIAGAAGGALGIASFMGITKLQAGFATALVVVGLSTGILETERNRALVGEIDHLKRIDPGLKAADRENKRLQSVYGALVGFVEQQRIAAATLRTDLAAARVGAASTTNHASSTGWSAPSAILASAPELNPGALDILPIPMDQMPPRYPPELTEKGEGGEVLVDFTVGADGSVINPTAISSTNKALEAPSVEAVSQWLFQPGQKEGNVVNTHMQVPIVYSPPTNPSR